MEPQATASRGALPRLSIGVHHSGFLRQFSTRRRSLTASENSGRVSLATPRGDDADREQSNSEDESQSHESSHPSYQDDDAPAGAPPAAQPASESAAAAKSPQARAVVALKLVLVAVLLSMGIAVAVFTHRILLAGEVMQFKDALDARVTQALQSLTDGYEGKQNGANLVAAHVATLTKQLALLPEQNYLACEFSEFFGAFNESMNDLAVSRQVLWAPLINASSLPAFNAFARGAVPTFIDAGPVASALSKVGVWAVSAQAGVPGPLDPGAPFYVPALFLVPFAPVQQFVLMDLMSFGDVAHTLSAVLQTGQAHQTDLFSLSDGGVSSATSIMFSPIFKPGRDADSVDADGDGTAVIGFAGVAFAWADMVFDGLRASGATGLIARVTSPSGNTQTFTLTAGIVSEVDAGYKRDAAFDAYRTQLTGSFGPGWAVELWPTQEMYGHYVTMAPTIESVTVAMIVLFVCLMFGVYDYVAATRAATLARMWQATEAVVADVFPHSVKKRLVQEALQRNRSVGVSASNGGPLADGTADGGGGAVMKIFNAFSGAADRRASGFIAPSAGGSAPHPAVSSSSAFGGFIADSYQSATVIFADIVGFTEWSSSVTPSEVFRVLEAVFGEFDALAKSLGVFKVETIGDCYMACVGVPDPKDDHALRAADFALGLADGFRRAGEATGVTHLCCRVGLHSGPVVAGVLRAEKHRFQLFGDTVNTASRMESTGEPRRVQCSAATAALLLNSGRHTLRRRGLIVVKGKGTVETYWLTGRLGRRTMRSHRSPAEGRSSFTADMSTDDAIRRATSAADDLSTIVAAEAYDGSVRGGSESYGRAEAAAIAADAAAQMAVQVAVAVTDDGFVRVIIDDSVTIDTSPAPAASLSARFQRTSGPLMPV